MTSPIPPLSLGTSPARGATPVDPRLVKSAQQLEGLFVRQLFAAMRETIPQDGALSGGPGEAMFTAMMHEHLADIAPTRWTHGVGAEITAKFLSPSAPDSK